MATLSSTQIGAIAENLVVNTLMIESGGRLSPFSPVADDGGIDVLIYDKESGRALPAQVKSRTVALKKKDTHERGNVVHFEVRAATFSSARHACVIFVLLTQNLSAIERAWVIPMRELPNLAAQGAAKYVVRANKSAKSADRYRSFRCEHTKDLVDRVLAQLALAPKPFLT